MRSNGEIVYLISNVNGRNITPNALFICEYFNTQKEAEDTIIKMKRKFRGLYNWTWFKMI